MFKNTVIAHAWRTNRPLTVLVLFSLCGLIVSLIGSGVDHRLINNEPGWIKPTKFSISLALYGATLIWLSKYLTRHAVFFRRVCTAAAIGTIVELTGIITQVIRGTTSHFNTSTALDHVMFGIITAAIMPVAFAMVATFWMLLHEKNLPPVVGTALRWATFVTVIGIIPGVLMIMPDHVQDVVTRYKQFDGHTIGFDEGGPGLPWLGWSTVAGDLRIAHFVGLHALQVMPIVGFFVLRFFPNLSPARQHALVTNAGFTYLGCVLVLGWQALRAESIVAPGPLTLRVVALLLAVSVAGFCHAIFGNRAAVPSVPAIPIIEPEAE